jgi:hypothetical protein
MVPGWWWTIARDIAQTGVEAGMDDMNLHVALVDPCGSPAEPHRTDDLDEVTPLTGKCS